MKKILLILCSLALTATVFAQQPYTVLVEKPNEKSYKGILSKQVLLADTSFHWYAENLKAYTPNAKALAALKENKDSVELIVFMGTWCHDSQFIIPKLYSLADAAGYDESRITMIGVDRQKTTISHLAEALNIKNVPTIMVMKNGNELGRVVEYGKYGLFDIELGEILSKASSH